MVILPRLGARRFADIRRAEIIALIEKTGDDIGHTTANRTQTVIRQVLH
jgi:hypothetical protein